MPLKIPSFKLALGSSGVDTGPIFFFFLNLEISMQHTIIRRTGRVVLGSSGVDSGV